MEWLEKSGGLRLSFYKLVLIGIIQFGALSDSLANVQIANMKQDLELIAREVAGLRTEVELLRRENAQLRISLEQASKTRMPEMVILKVFSYRFNQESIS